MSTIGYYICVPFAWLVRLFYNLTNSYGVALILFTLVIKLIMLPFQMKFKKSMMRMSRVSGQMQELQKRYAKNQAKLQEEMQKLYEEEGVNPMSGCLWSLIPFPILIALYSIIRQPITHFMMLSKDVLQTVVQSAADAGVNLTNIVMMDKATGAPALKDGLYQMAAYGQINLVKAVQEMKAKRRLLFQILAVVLLVAIGYTMTIIGRGHTIYLDSKTLEYDGQTYKPAYKTVVYVDGQQVAKLYDKERGVATCIGQMLTVTLEITQQKGGTEEVYAYNIPVPRKMDNVIINLPGFLAGLPEEAYLSEFIPSPDEVAADETDVPSDDDFGMEDMGMGDESAAQ